MKKMALAAKISVVTTSILTGVLLCGSVICNENSSALNSFFGIIPYKKVETSTENQDTEYYKSEFNSVKDVFNAGKKLVSDIEAEGATLVKNDNNALPLKKTNKVSLFSISSVDPAYGGKGSVQTNNPQPPVKPVDGLTSAGLDVNGTLLNFYETNKAKYKRNTNGKQINDAHWDDLVADSAVDASINTYNDAAIVILSRPLGGEGSDLRRVGTDGENGNYLRLNENEKSIFTNLKARKQEGKIKKIVVLLNTASHIEADFLDNPEYGIDAALWMGSAGIAGFDAVGKILVGDVNPSGHLADTMWTQHALNPVTANLGSYTYPNYGDYELPTDSKQRRFSSYIVYQEGIYLGYRYSETRYYDVVTKRTNAGTFNYDSTIYRPFGYGQSYTTFAYKDFKARENGDKIDIEITVQNTGDVDGKDAVQIYAQKPYTTFDIENKIEKAAVELVGFAKTPIIKAKEEAKIQIEVDKYALTSYDAEVNKTYILEEGDYYLTAGLDSHNAVNNILASQGYTTSDGMDEAGLGSLANKIHLNEDTKTYAKSKATDKKITNLFDEADINKYHGKGKNKVDYVSRNNWNDTLPENADDHVELVMTGDLAKELVSQDDVMQIEKTDEEMPKFGVNNHLNLIDLFKDGNGNEIKYDDPIWEELLDQITSFDELSAMAINGLRMTKGLSVEIDGEVLINKPETVEHNGPAGLVLAYGKSAAGKAHRTNDPDGNMTPPYYPCIGIVASTFNIELAEQFGKMLGEDAIWSGFTGFYGLGLNTHRSAYGGRTYEYWSEDPLLTGKMCAAQTRELQKRGMNGYIKHFALNDQETQRNDIQIWANEQTLREIYLKPFEYAVVEGGANNAMASFTRIGAIHCPQSKALMTDYLRGELGMKGFVVTDMYSIGYTPDQMPLFLMAGTDLADGSLSVNPFKRFETYPNVVIQLRESVKRMCYMTLHSNAMNGMSATTIMVPYTPFWVTTLIAIDSVMSILLIASVGFSVFVWFKSKKEF